jgi:hypothetical protein
MQLLSWLRKKMTGRTQTRLTPARKRPGGLRPRLEALEGRDLPSFSMPVSYGGVSFGAYDPLALAAAGINGDAKPSLFALSAYGTSLFLNQGKGTFGSGGGPVLGDLNPDTAIAVGDVNGDGTADIVLAEAPPIDPFGSSPDSVLVLLGDGQGNFRSAATYPYAQDILPTGSSISSLALADVNGDGKPDLIAVDSSGDVFVAPNEGNGIFGTAQRYWVPEASNGSSVPVEVAVGDVNGDGKPDIVATDPPLNSVSVLPNAGNGTFGAAQTYAVGGAPAALAVGDVSGDGKLDLVTANTNGTVSVLVNQGTGAFGAAQSYAVGGPVNSVALADFNHDGRLDIATAGSTETDVLLNTGGGAFAAYRKVGPAGSSVVAADFNGDGYPDLALGDRSGTSIDVLLNNTYWSPTPSFAVAGFPASTTAGVSQSFTVTALSPDGTVDTGYSGTVHFTSSDPQAVLPANSTLSNGVGTFLVTLKTAGDQSITATDTTTGVITGYEWDITVNPAAAAKFILSAPARVARGAAFSMTLTVEDAFGNVATGYTGTVHFSSSDSTASLPADYTFTARDAGTRTFTLPVTSVVLRQKGKQTLTATDTANRALTATDTISVG